MAQGASIAGQILGHYRLVEQIGAGGMGMVFLASDQELERDVAIKVLPQGMLADEAARKRFRREALTLAKLNHPNIGTVYEFGSQRGVDFLVMEYVGGTGIDTRLASGPLSIKEVLRIGFQLADGLASAHDHGIIHRDLKPANLRLTRDNRLKILDFGLAQFVKLDSELAATVSTSESKQVSGTLPYMSPEQLRAELLDPRSDIWSAGVVLYELVTGRKPFPFSQVTVLVDAILNKAPQPPSALNPKVSPGLEVTILKCLDKDPERRYQSARELRVDLDRLTMPVSQVPSAAVLLPPKSTVVVRARKPLLAGLLAVLIVAAIAFSYMQLRHKREEASSKPINHRRTVAVLNFKNATSRPEAAWLSTALPEMLTTELGAGEKLRTIRGDEVAQMKLNLALPDGDVMSPSLLAQVGKALGADLVVLGSYVSLSGGRLRVDLHLQDVASGETLVAVKQTGDEENLFDLVSHAGAELRQACNAGQLNVEDEGAVRATFPSNPEASKLYAEGLAKLRVNEGIPARDILQKAVAADPNNALAHSALAAAWNLLGYDEKARLSAKSAYELSSALSREDHLLIEARYREMSKEWDNAAEDYRTLFGFFPDNLEYGLLLARAQTKAGKGKQALTSVDSLRRLPSPSGQDPRIDLVASDTWRSLGDFKQADAFATASVQKARAQGAKLLLARALYQKGAAVESLGDTSGAMVATEEAARIYKEVGDRYGLASTFEVTAQALADRGDYSGALAQYRNEIAIAREIGNRKAESSALNNMALVLDQQGDTEQARQMFERALPVFQEVSDRSNYAMTLVNIAGIMKDDGDLLGAKKTYEQSLSIFTEVNDQNGISLSRLGIGTVMDSLGDSMEAKKIFEDAVGQDLASGQSSGSPDKLIDLGDTLQHLGDLNEARAQYGKAVSLSRAAGDKSMAAYALAGLGELDLKAADFAQAHKDYEDALALRNELGERDTVASTHVEMADLAIEEGYPETAEAPARESEEYFARAHRRDDQLLAAAVLIRSLVIQGKTEDAAKEVSKVKAVVASTQNLSVQLAFATAKAEAEEASHQNPEAKALVKAALIKADKSHYLYSQMELELEAEKLEFVASHSPAAHARIAQLQKEANGKGFLLITHKAAALEN